MISCGPVNGPLSLSLAPIAGLKSCVDPSNLSVLSRSFMMIRASDIASVFFLSR